MSNETTSTSWSSLRVTEILGSLPLPANLPKIVALNLVNRDSIAGMPGLTKKYPVHQDDGAASAATEGTDITANNEFDMAAAVTVAVSEQAAVRAEITDVALERRYPGMGGVAGLVQRADPQEILGALGPFAGRMQAMLLEKAEDDVTNLFDNFSNTAGSTGQDLTVSNLMTAIYTLKTLEPNGAPEDWCFCLTPNQLHEARLELGVTNGGLGGSVWFQQADVSFFNFRPDLPRNGFQGSFLGIPVYEYSHSLRNLEANAGADVSGVLMVRGVGAPDEPGGQVGAISFVEGRDPPISYYAELDASLRSIQLVATYVYNVAEIKDTHGVSIITDAP